MSAVICPLIRIFKYAYIHLYTENATISSQRGGALIHLGGSLQCIDSSSLKYIGITNGCYGISYKTEAWESNVKPLIWIPS